MPLDLLIRALDGAPRLDQLRRILRPVGSGSSKEAMDGVVTTRRGKRSPSHSSSFGSTASSRR